MTDPTTGAATTGARRRYLSARAVKDLGLLQEINRLLLHPRGLALCLVTGAEERVGAIEGGLVMQVWDARDDPEGIWFNLADDAPAERVATMERRRTFAALAAPHLLAREQLFGPGVVVEPLPDDED